MATIFNQRKKYHVSLDGASFIQNHFVERSVVTRVAETGSKMSESDLSKISDSRLRHLNIM